MRFSPAKSPTATGTHLLLRLLFLLLHAQHLLLHLPVHLFRFPLGGPAKPGGSTRGPEGSGVGGGQWDQQVPKGGFIEILKFWGARSQEQKEEEEDEGSTAILTLWRTC